LGKALPQPGHLGQCQGSRARARTCKRALHGRVPTPRS